MLKHSFSSEVTLQGRAPPRGNKVTLKARPTACFATKGQLLLVKLATGLFYSLPVPSLPLGLLRSHPLPGTSSAPGTIREVQDAALQNTTQAIREHMSSSGSIEGLPQGLAGNLQNVNVRLDNLRGDVGRVQEVLSEAFRNAITDLSNSFDQSVHAAVKQGPSGADSEIVKAMQENSNLLTEAIVSVNSSNRAHEEITKSLFNQLNSSLDQVNLYLKRNSWILIFATVTIGIVIYKRRSNNIICDCRPQVPETALPLDTSPNLDYQLAQDKFNREVEAQLQHMKSKLSSDGEKVVQLIPNAITLTKTQVVLVVGGSIALTVGVAWVGWYFWKKRRNNKINTNY